MSKDERCSDVPQELTNVIFHTTTFLLSVSCCSPHHRLDEHFVLQDLKTCPQCMPTAESLSSPWTEDVQSMSLLSTYFATIVII